MTDEWMFITKQDFFHGGLVVVYPLSAMSGTGTIGVMKCSMPVLARRGRLPAKGAYPFYKLQPVFMFTNKKMFMYMNKRIS